MTVMPIKCNNCKVQFGTWGRQCPYCGQVMELVQGPERHLVGESRSDGPAGGVEEAKPGRRGVGEIVERDELLRHIDGELSEARRSRRQAMEDVMPSLQSFYEGRVTALSELRNHVRHIAAERSDLPNAERSRGSGSAEINQPS